MQTVTVPINTFEKILSRLEYLTKTVEDINEKLEGAPPHGSDEWWQWSEKKADEDIKNGRVSAPFQTKKDLQQYLDSLKTR